MVRRIIARQGVSPILLQVGLARSSLVIDGMREGVIVANAFATLLASIVRDLVVPDAQKDVDLNAHADESAEAIESAKAHAVEQAEARETTLGPSFETGLILAFEAQGIGHPEIKLDDRNPEENAIADALITYLVGFDLAESRSVETESGHYDYFISVNWDPLYDFANNAGIDLPSALANAATIPSG
jgi:hypothetical protein